MSTEINTILPSHPYAEEIGVELGSWRESIVRELGSDLVHKSVIPSTRINEYRKQEGVAYKRIPELVKIFSKEQADMEKILGGEHFRREYYIQMGEKDGLPIYDVVQKRVKGPVMQALVGVGREYKSREEMVYRNREEYMELVWVRRNHLLS